MAEGITENTKLEESDKSNECPICLQKFIHPAQLPCGHIFCFLCVKGIANRSNRCAMCRQDIPSDYVEQPKLLSQPDTQELADESFQWFYEGRNGWWQYDQRASEDIEQAYKLNLDKVELLICGETYVIDLQENIQYPKSHSLRKRSIKRDSSLVLKHNIKGVAGIHKKTVPNNAGS